MVTVVIPTWNQCSLLRDVLDDLGRQTLPASRILVVDNGSDVAARVVGAELIRFPVNQGFARAVNAGVRAATTKWVLILNNDVRLPPDWLEIMVASAEASGACFVGPKLLQARDRGRIDGGFDALSRSGFAWRCGNGRLDGPVFSMARAVQFVPLTAALVQRELFDRVGFLEERQESYYEDVEFFLRCGLAGIEGRYEPAAVAEHVGSATLGEWNKDTVFRLTRNQRYLSRIYLQELPRRPVLVGQLLWILLALRHGCGWASIRGWFAGGKMPRNTDRGPVNSEIVRRIVTDGDSTIRELQIATGFDWFWKMYFRWAG